jgi:hypothetical protein
MICILQIWIQVSHISADTCGAGSTTLKKNWISRRREAETGFCQFLQLVLQNVRHFISLSGQPAWQLAALGKHSANPPVSLPGSWLP